MTVTTAPCFAHFPDGSIVLVATIDKDGLASVCNEDGEWWVEPPDRLTPAEPGVTW